MRLWIWIHESLELRNNTPYSGVSLRDSQTSGWTDGRLDGRMDGWMEGREGGHQWSESASRYCSLLGISIFITLMLTLIIYSALLLRPILGVTPPQGPLWPFADLKPGWRRRVGGGLAGCRCRHREKRRMKSNGRWRRVNWKHRDMKGEGKGDGHQQGCFLRIPEPVLIAWKLTYWGS